MIEMFDRHKQLNEYYNNHVRLNSTERNKLAGYRDTNLVRLNTGLDKLSELDGRTYAYPKESCNQGSYAMHTLNQHPDNDYDIDVAIIFHKDDLPSSPLDARRRIEAALRHVSANFAKEPEARTNAVTVWYAEGYHIDFAIYREYINDWGRTIVEHAGPSWTSRHPADITNWFNETVNSLSPSKDYGATVDPGQVRRVVRLLKAFSRSRESWSLPGGLIISALVAEVYCADYHRDDVALYNTMIAIRNRLLGSTTIYNPVDTTQLLTSKAKDKHQVERLRDKLGETIGNLSALFNSDCTESQAQSAWYSVFQHSYWSVEQSSAATTSNRKHLAQTPQFGNLKLVAELAFSKGGHLKQQYPSGSHRLPKNLWLRFRIARCDIQPPFDVHWIVNNKGDEAEEATDLGHQVIDSTNNQYSMQWERTKYKGNHTITCELRRNGIVLARAKHVVKIKER